jgi:hypothetical protein
MSPIETFEPVVSDDNTVELVMHNIDMTSSIACCGRSSLSIGRIARSSSLAGILIGLLMDAEMRLSKNLATDLVSYTLRNVFILD